MPTRPFLHRLPGLYPDPARFDPGRWLPVASGSAAPHQASILTFGAGPAKCIGEQFGLAEATPGLGVIEVKTAKVLMQARSPCLE